MSTNNDIAELLKNAQSAFFVGMAERAKEFGLEPRVFVRGQDKEFAEWITLAAQEASKKCEKTIVRIVSGEFNVNHWNTLPKEEVWDILKGRCDVKGTCCGYVSVVDNAANGEPYNDAYNFFRDAVESGMTDAVDGIRLYRSYYREDCHWIAIGDELHMTDWHKPLGNENSNHADDFQNTLIIESEKVSEFAKREFDLVLKRQQAAWSYGKPEDDIYRVWLSRHAERLNLAKRNQAICSADSDNYFDIWEAQNLDIFAPYLIDEDDGVFTPLTAQEIKAKYARGDLRIPKRPLASVA